MRPCPTCQCFVPDVARQCPRCSAALEPIEAAIEVEAAVDARELVYAGGTNGIPTNGTATNGRAPLAGSGHDAHRHTAYRDKAEEDAATRRVLAHVMLPPIDGPAGRPRRPSLPKLPQPFAPDPLVLAVFLGIPVVESDATTETDHQPTGVSEGHISPPTHAGSLALDSFSALLGIPREDQLPRAPTVAPPRPPKPTAPPAPALVAVPVATTRVHTEPVALPRRRRLFTRHDPFARTSTRKERVLARIVLVLVLALPGVVIMLRLPVGIRPELSAIFVRDGASTSVTRAGDPARLQARSDLTDTLTVAEEVYPNRNTYASATPDVLNDSLPQLTFVSRTHISRRLGEISVSGSADRIVLAEASANGECLFARIVGSDDRETVVLPNGNPCRASAAPKRGWTAFGIG